MDRVKQHLDAPIKDRICLGKAMWRSLDHRNPISMVFRLHPGFPGRSEQRPSQVWT
jgi:hypothetical protein